MKKKEKLKIFWLLLLGLFLLVLLTGSVKAQDNLNKDSLEVIAISPVNLMDMGNDIIPEAYFLAQDINSGDIYKFRTDFETEVENKKSQEFNDLFEKLENTIVAVNKSLINSSVLKIVIKNNKNKKELRIIDLIVQKYS